MSAIDKIHEVAPEFFAALTEYQSWISEQMERDPFGYEPPTSLETLGRVEFELKQLDFDDAYCILNGWLYSYHNAGHLNDVPTEFDSKRLEKAVTALDDALANWYN